MRLYMHTKCLIIKQNNSTNKIDFYYSLKNEKKNNITKCIHNKEVLIVQRLHSISLQA